MHFRSPPHHTASHLRSGTQVLGTTHQHTCLALSHSTSNTQGAGGAAPASAGRTTPTSARRSWAGTKTWRRATGTQDTRRTRRPSMSQMPPRLPSLHTRRAPPCLARSPRTRASANPGTRHLPSVQELRVCTSCAFLNLLSRQRCRGACTWVAPSACTLQCTYKCIKVHAPQSACARCACTSACSCACTGACGIRACAIGARAPQVPAPRLKCMRLQSMHLCPAVHVPVARG